MRLKNLLGVLSVFLAGASAQAEELRGANSSGGGGAYVCRNAEGKVISSRLVDLWEAANTPFAWQKLGRRKINVDLFSEDSVDAQLQAAVVRLRGIDSYYAELVEKELAEVRSVINYLPSDVSLTIPNDLQTDYFPTGCPPEGMMRYNGFSESLDVNAEIFSALATKTDVAAAYMHEAIYKVARGYRSEYAPRVGNSILIRRMVGCLFSAECVAAAKFVLPPTDEAYRCSSPGFDGYFYKAVIGQKEGWGLAVTRAGSRLIGGGLEDKDDGLGGRQNSWLWQFKLYEHSVWGSTNGENFNGNNLNINYSVYDLYKQTPITVLTEKASCELVKK